MCPSWVFPEMFKEHMVLSITPAAAAQIQHKTHIGTERSITPPAAKTAWLAVTQSEVCGHLDLPAWLHTQATQGKTFGKPKGFALRSRND